MKNLLILATFLLTYSVSNSQNIDFKKGDKWTGSYQCSNSKIDLEIYIDEVQGDIIRSRFIFLGGKGEYEMIGKIKDNEFTFMGTNWIKNPGDSFVTLGLHGFYLNSPDRLIGNLLSKLTFIEGNECTGFYLEKKSYGAKGKLIFGKWFLEGKNNTIEFTEDGKVYKIENGIKNLEFVGNFEFNDETKNLVLKDCTLPSDNGSYKVLHLDVNQMKIERNGSTFILNRLTK